MPSAVGSWWEAVNLTMLASLSDTELLDYERAMLRNITHHINDPAFDLLRSAAWRGLVLTLYISVILIGIVGNVAVVCVVVRNRAMHNVTNILIANLALSDIGLCAFSLPVQLYYQLTDHWVFGELLCRVVFAAFALPMYVSILTILLIAYDRYWLIVYPLRPRMSVRTGLSLLLLTIVTSLLLSVPVMCFTSLHHLDEPDLHIRRKYCVEQWPSPAARQTYSLLMFAFQFCLPLLVTTLLYCRIARRLRQRRLQRATTGANASAAPSCERKQKTNKILVAIVALFILCWLPWNVFSLITELDFYLVRGPHFKFVDLLLKVFAMSSACVNPFLYCWLNDNFRRELDTIAVKLHVYRGERGGPSAQGRRSRAVGVGGGGGGGSGGRGRGRGGNGGGEGPGGGCGKHLLQVPGAMENGMLTSDTNFGTITSERRSSAQPSTNESQSHMYGSRRSSTTAL